MQCGTAILLEVYQASHAGRHPRDPLPAHVPHGRGRRFVRERPGRVHQGQVRRLRGLYIARERGTPTRLPGDQQAQSGSRDGHGKQLISS